MSNQPEHKYRLFVLEPDSAGPGQIVTIYQYSNLLMAKVKGENEYAKCPGVYGVMYDEDEDRWVRDNRICWNDSIVPRAMATGNITIKLHGVMS